MVAHRRLELPGDLGVHVSEAVDVNLPRGAPLAKHHMEPGASCENGAGEGGRVWAPSELLLGEARLGGEELVRLALEQRSVLDHHGLVVDVRQPGPA